MTARAAKTYRAARRNEVRAAGMFSQWVSFNRGKSRRVSYVHRPGKGFAARQTLKAAA